MLDAYLGWPEQMERMLSSWGSVRVSGEFESVVIAGMGGSGAVGDMAALVGRDRSSLPIFVLKGHTLPRFVGEGTLFVGVSYSGNTHETLAAVSSAAKRGAKVAVVTSGGKMAQLALKEGYPMVRVPPGMAPRASLPSMLVGLLGLLDASGVTLASKSEAGEAARAVRAWRGAAVELGTRLASFALKGGLLVIATHTPLEPLAWRAKSEFNENSKTLAKVDVAPEWMHNDIVGHERPMLRDFRCVAFYDADDSVGRRLVEFMASVYREAGAEVVTLEISGSSMLEKAVKASLLFGVASVKLAEMRGIDPLETKSIGRYKALANEIFTEG